MKRNHINVLAVAAVCGALASVGLMLVRVDSAMSLAFPMHVVTSGWEQQPLFSIWRALHGEGVFLDGTRIPFAIAFYNWLFYEVYAHYVRWVLDAFSLEEAWLPTVARTLTLLGSVAGAIIASLTLCRIAGMEERWGQTIAAAFACFVFFGPLVGFWGFTVRPDVWVLALEVLAIYLFWRGARDRPITGILLACACLYAAWAFKHSSVMATVTIGLYLLLERRFRHLLIFAGVLGSAYALTFAVGGATYVRSLLYTAEVSWDIGYAARIAVNFLLKSAPTVFGVGALAILAMRDARLRAVLSATPALRFALVGVAVCTVLTLAGTAKEGAAENYYFLLSFFLCLTTVVGLQAAAVAGRARPVVLASAAGWGVLVVAIGAVLAGFHGVRSVAFQHDYYAAKARCLAGLREPWLIDDQYLSLPWMNPSRPAFVLSYNYPLQRSAGLPLQEDGIAGLIQRRYFAALALGHASPTHDGAALTGYAKRPETCAGLTIWIRSD